MLEAAFRSCIACSRMFSDIHFDLVITTRGVSGCTNLVGILIAYLSVDSKEGSIKPQIHQRVVLEYFPIGSGRFALGDQVLVDIITKFLAQL